MSGWKQFTHWITGRAERDLDRELRAHLDLEAEEQQDSGLPPRKAGYAARRTFGNVTSRRRIHAPCGDGVRWNDYRKTCVTRCA